jgi:mono/diheme cytochrome c family protein
MRRLGIAVLLIVIVVAAIVFALTIRRGFSTHDAPTAFEAMIAARMRQWAVPAELRHARNPVVPMPGMLAEARAHFADHCAICHGNDGKGKTAMGPHFYPRTPDLTLASTQLRSDGELFATIENGVRMTGMPAFGDGTAESRRASWMLVHFIRHLPKITPAELAEMEKLNPKSPAEWKEMEAEDSFLRGRNP